MKVNCVWEHNGNDSLLYSSNIVGAFTRGASKEEAVEKMPEEIVSFMKWSGYPVPSLLTLDIAIIQEKESDLRICDADSDVLFDTECLALSVDDYRKQKDLVLKSAEGFLALYEAFPDKHHTVIPERKTFYGSVPRTAEEMYQHTKNVNAYYFAELGVNVDNEGNIAEC